FGEGSDEEEEVEAAGSGKEAREEGEGTGSPARAGTVGEGGGYGVRMRSAQRWLRLRAREATIAAALADGRSRGDGAATEAALADEEEAEEAACVAELAGDRSRGDGAATEAALAGGRSRGDGAVAEVIVGLTIIGAMKLQLDDGSRSSLGIGPGLDDLVGPRREFTMRFAEGIGKLTRNTPGDRRKKIERLTVRIPKATGLAGVRS
ncbi:hypothetical protein BHM03_00030968, partial [Ensete ventricosum]